MTEPIIFHTGAPQTDEHRDPAAIGHSFHIYAWSGSGPDYLHVHYKDDEAWHVLEGTLTFRFPDRVIQAPAGTTLFVPAGLPQTYYEADGPTRYLLILTPRLRELIDVLHTAPIASHGEVLERFASARVD